MDIKKFIFEDLLDEGYFHLPEKVYSKITDSYLAAYRKYKTQNIKRATEKTFPDEVFDIDFSGTSFEFLNNMNPPPSVTVHFNVTRNQSYFHPKDIESKNRGYIALDLQQGPRGVYDVIEHEMLHFVQYLIQKYKKEKLNKTLSSKFGNKEKPITLDRLRSAIRSASIGGLPSADLLPSDKTVSGYKKGGGFERRVQHSHRPVEYYPDLLSSVRELHKKYHEKYGDSPDWEKIRYSEHDRKAFFLKFLEDVKNGEGRGIAPQVFSNFKKISPSFSRKMMAIAYDAFVNKPENFDPAKLKKTMQDISDETLSRQKEEKFVASKIKMKREWFTSMVTSGFYSGETLLFVQDSDNNENALRFLQDIGLTFKTKAEKYIDLPQDIDGIKNLFKKIQDLKTQKKVYHLKFYVREGQWPNQVSREVEPSPSQIDSFYNSIAYPIKMHYVRAVLPGFKQELYDIINSSYNF